MSNRRLLSLIAFGLLTGQAEATTTTLSIIINSPPSTTLSCPLKAYTAPLAAGSTVCSITISPAEWSGALAISGVNASSFALVGQNLVVGSTALPAGSYSVTITATP